jgi:hypothetical protein
MLTFVKGEVHMIPRNKVLNVVFAFLLAILVAGCSDAASSPSLRASESSDSSITEAYEDGATTGTAESNDANKEAPKLAAPEKMVYTADVSLSTREFDEASKELDAKLEAAGAIIFGDSTQQTDWSDHPQRTRQLTIRVASEGLKDLVKSVSEISSVTVKSSNVHASDRTKEYNDSESRIQLLKQEYDFYEQTLKETTDPDTRLKYTDRMFELLDEIKGLENTKSEIDKDVAYSVMDITLSEDTALSDQDGSAGLWQEIQDAFVMIPANIAAAFGYLLLFFIRILPLLVFAGIIAGIVIAIVKHRKARRPKQGKPVSSEPADDTSANEVSNSATPSDKPKTPGGPRNPLDSD